MYNKLFQIQQQLLSFKKDGKNPHFKSSYLTLDNLLEKLLPVCNQLGVLIYHKTLDGNVVTVVTDAEGKNTIESSFPIGDTSNPQKVGSAITYGKRYNLGQIFNIVTDDDDDGNKASIPAKTKEDSSFDKRNFTPTMFRSLVDDLKKGNWKMDIEQTLKYITDKYILSLEIETDIRQYFDAHSKGQLDKPLDTNTTK